MTEHPALKGLRIEVYRLAAREMDYTLGGVTATHDNLTVVGVIDATEPGRAGFAPVPDWRVDTPTPAAPPVAVVLRTGWNNDDLYVYLEPVDIAPDRTTVRRRPGWAMDGSNCAGTGDRRFVNVLQAITGYPHIGVLRVHDRYE